MHRKTAKINQKNARGAKRNSGKCRGYTETRGQTAPSVHYTESIVPVLKPIVKDKSAKSGRNYANRPGISPEYPLTSIFSRAKIALMQVDSGKWTVMEQTAERKSFFFAVRIVKLCKHLNTDKKEYVLTKQLLRSGTSIGANVAEAEQAQSRADFISKMNIALKEAAETDYWLRLLQASEYLSEAEFFSIHRDCKELEKMLTAIVKTAKQ